MKPICSSVTIALAVWSLGLGSLCAADLDLPLIAQDDFEQGIKRWQALDADGWKAKSTDRGIVLSQFKKESHYRGPHRSPFHVALLKEVQVSDFVLDVDVLSTHPDYGHRDACLFFGYQDAAHFYYVHLGKKADDHANQIFIVNNADRTKISTKSTPGTDWDDKWHHVRIVRRTKQGTIEVFFDDMSKPIMTASDKNFVRGRVGLGSFDDTADWDNFRLRGIKVAR